MSEVKLDDIVSLCKRRGFIYPGSDVYGGLSGTWDYGPLGVTLKKNIMNLWWKMFVDDADNMYGIDAAILMNQKVWQASGHVDTFADPLVECGQCGARERADKLVTSDAKLQSIKDSIKRALAELYELRRDFEDSKGFEPKPKTPTHKEFMDYITEHLSGLTNRSAQIWIDRELHTAGLYKDEDPEERIPQERLFKATGDEFVTLLTIQIYLVDLPCPRCGAKQWSSIRQFNMMFKTNVGPVDDESSVSYLRPETAQGIFTNFKNVVDSYYPDMPFGLAQQGKAFRNEISPRDFVFRSREFEQMEIEYFIHPDTWEQEFEEWVKRIHLWCDALGLPKEKVHELEVPAEDRAHYSKRTIDFEYDFPIGREELLGLAYRTDFDLGNIQRVSGKSMEYRPKDGSAPFVPHVIEPSFGVERALMAVLSAAYTEDEINGEKRVYLKLPAYLAPVKVAVLPLAKNKPELVAKAREVYAMLKRELGAVLWVDTGNIGKNYRKMDEIGVPYCVTVDFETLEGDTAGTVTVRHRDTTNQERVGIEALGEHVRA